MKPTLLVALLFCLASPLQARTWEITVDGLGDAPTVQAGIDSAGAGDTVLVGPGTYYENLVLQSKNIALRSQLGAASTMLDGSMTAASVILCRDGITNETLVEGFTITGGSGTDFYSTGDRLGGGLSCLNAAPTIRGNIIIGNRAEDIPPNPTSSGSRGGGIAFGGPDHSLPPIIIEENVIADNFAFANGGGINIAWKCVIRNNEIRGNQTGHGDGGGLYYYNSPVPILIENNLIRGNVAADHGGGIHLAAPFYNSPPASDLQIIGNILIGNEAHNDLAEDCSGGAIFSYGGAVIRGNTIAFNVAENVVPPPAGGICVWAPRAGTIIENNVIQGNSLGGVVARLAQSPWAVTLLHNLLFANAGADVVADPEAIEETEDLYSDALFCTEGPTSLGELAGNSPALSSPYGIIGAVSVPGCGPEVAARPITWGRLKTRYQ